MSRSLLQAVNPSEQSVDVGGIISPGAVSRRFGCNIRLNGNTIEIEGAGYYTIDGTVTVAPTAAGGVSVAVYENGAPVPGITAAGTAAAIGNDVTLPVCGTVRLGCCGSASALSLVLTAGASAVTNVSLRVEKI